MMNNIPMKLSSLLWNNLLAQNNHSKIIKCYTTKFLTFPKRNDQYSPNEESTSNGKTELSISKEFGSKNISDTYSYSFLVYW